MSVGEFLMLRKDNINIKVKVSVCVIIKNVCNYPIGYNSPDYLTSI